MGALCSLIFFYKYSIYCPILILGVRVSYYSFSLNILKTASEIHCPEALKQKRGTDKLKRVWRKADNRVGTVEHVMFDVGQLVLSSLRKGNCIVVLLLPLPYGYIFEKVELHTSQGEQ